MWVSAAALFMYMVYKAPLEREAIGEQEMPVSLSFFFIFSIAVWEKERKTVRLELDATGMLAALYGRLVSWLVGPAKPVFRFVHVGVALSRRGVICRGAAF